MIWDHSILSQEYLFQVLSQCRWPRRYRLLKLTGKVKQISFINKAIYESIKMGKVEERYIKTKDHKDLQMWIIYPPDFDPAKKYPALLFCNGGPQAPIGQSGRIAGTIR